MNGSRCVTCSKTDGQAINFGFRRLRVVIEIGLDADSVWGDTCAMKRLPHHMNHFAVSHEMKVIAIQFDGFDS